MAAFCAIHANWRVSTWPNFFQFLDFTCTICSVWQVTNLHDLARWREHYNTMLNHPPAMPCPDLTAQASGTSPATDVSSDAPTLAEVCRAIRKLNNGRAAGPDSIFSELLKCAETPISAALHKLFQNSWSSGRVPAEWRDGIIISLYKGKGHRNQCSSYRHITLLSVPGKVFSHVLLSS